MNYKKLKRVFALGMAVLLSVSTSVYGGTMEVRAAEAISNDLLENEVIDNSSLDENTENKGDDQNDEKDAEQGDNPNQGAHYTHDNGGARQVFHVLERLARDLCRNTLEHIGDGKDPDKDKHLYGDGLDVGVEHLSAHER